MSILKFGVEFETELITYDEKIKEHIYGYHEGEFSLMKNWKIERDASLKATKNGNCVEIITTILKDKQELDEAFDELATYVNVFNVNETMGLHLHVTVEEDLDFVSQAYLIRSVYKNFLRNIKKVVSKEEYIAIKENYFRRYAKNHRGFNDFSEKYLSIRFVDKNRLELRSINACTVSSLSTIKQIVLAALAALSQALDSYESSFLETYVVEY